MQVYENGKEGMMHGKVTQNGFTLVEILLAVFFLGAVAMFTVPKIMETTGTQTAYSKAKNMGSYIQMAADSLKEDEPTLDLTDATIPTQIADNTKYTIIITDGTKLTTDINRSGEEFIMPDCEAATPCYRFADGGVLMPYAWFSEDPPTVAQPTAVFLYDPDNTGNISPVTLMLDFDTERISTKDGFLNGEAYYDSNIPPGDPAYVRSWTKL